MFVRRLGKHKQDVASRTARVEAGSLNEFKPDERVGGLNSIARTGKRASSGSS